MPNSVTVNFVIVPETPETAIEDGYNVDAPGMPPGVLVARFLHSSWLSLGDVPVLEGSLGALAALVLARRLLM